MKIYSFRQQGKRKNNEDYQGKNDSVVTVCDGMGGHAAGEVASKFVVEETLKMFADSNEELTKDIINERLSSIQVKLSGLLEDNPDKEGMGTTFTGVFPGRNFWHVAHIGDSRVYFVRPSENLIWHTWDHSMVGELMRMNEITRERGRNHPMANRISRAIIANRDGKTAIADVAKIDNLRKGDLFLLCSDGIGDAWRDDEICELLCDENISAEKKLNTIKEKCDKESNDNNTAYLIEIEEKDVISNGDNNELKWIPLKDLQDNYQLYLKEEAEENDVVQLVEDENPKPSNTKGNAKPNQSKAVVPNKKPQNSPKNKKMSKLQEMWRNYKRFFLGMVILVAFVLLCGIVVNHYQHPEDGKVLKNEIETVNVPESKNNGAAKSSGSKKDDKPITVTEDIRPDNTVTVTEVNGQDTPVVDGHNEGQDGFTQNPIQQILQNMSPAGNQSGNLGGNPEGNQSGNPEGNQSGNPEGNQSGNPEGNQSGNLGGDPEGNQSEAPKPQPDTTKQNPQSQGGEGISI